MGEAVQFKNGHQTINAYDASGRKLSTFNIIIPQTNAPIIVAENTIRDFHLYYDCVDTEGIHHFNNIEYTSYSYYAYLTVFRL